MFRIRFFSAIAVTGMLLGLQPALAENRLALVIGQSAYRAVTPLPNPANDAKAVAQMLGDAGFEVQSATDLSQNDLRQAVGEFAARMSQKGPDTVALVFYAGHGMQIDGENFLVPVDIDPKRETDIPLQAVRLNDILNTLTSVPSKMRIIMLDACRNDPFPEIGKTAGRGLALVDTKIGAVGTLLSYSTSPGAEAEDGDGANSPYTTALLSAAREPGLSIEDAFKRVRLSVNKATSGRQTPWESSSLTSEFKFFGGAGDSAPKPAVAKRSVDDWRTALKGKPIGEANDMIVSDGSVDAYEAFVGLYTEPPFGPQASQWLDRHRRMAAWNRTVIANTSAAYRAFLAQYPDSDLTATARKLEERLRNRPDNALAAINATPNTSSPSAATPAALTCPCGAPAAPVLPKRVETPTKGVDAPPKKRAEREKPKREPDRPRRVRGNPDDDVVVYRRPPPVYDDPEPQPYIGGGGYSGGGYGGGYRGGNYGGGGGYGGRGRY